MVDYIKLPIDKAETLLGFLKKAPWEFANDAIIILMNAEKIMKPTEGEIKDAGPNSMAP